MTSRPIQALALVLISTVPCAAGRFVGAEKCTVCHIREGEVWKQSRHFKSFADLPKHPKTADLLRAVGEKSFAESKVCAHCHLTVVSDEKGEQRHAVSGPSCESCHGPASEWMPAHADQAEHTDRTGPGQDLRAERRRSAHEKGMHDHSDLFNVARNCMACHGLNHPELDGETLHKLLAAGHSIEPSYDLAHTAEGDMRHRFYPVPDGTENRPRTPEELAHLIVVGQVARLLSARDAQAKSKDAGYHAGQLQREELAREALTPLARWPPMAAFLAAPDEERGRAVVAAADSADRAGLVRALLPHLVGQLGQPPAAEDDARSLPWFKRMMANAGSAVRTVLKTPSPPPASIDPPAAKEPVHEVERRPASGEEALEMLLAGNLRFAAGRSRPGHESAQWRKALTKGQHPFAVVLSCSDSRVPVELVFDQGFGDLFVIRVAGNVFSPDTAGSILYAVHHLHAKLLVVMGHESCGAVTASMDFDPARSQEPSKIQAVLRMVAPAVKQVDPATPKEHRLTEAIKENVRLTIRKLREDPAVRHAEQEEGLLIVGGVYQISTGTVYRIVEQSGGRAIARSGPKEGKQK